MRLIAAESSSTRDSSYSASHLSQSVGSSPKTAASVMAAPPDDTYRLGPDSEPHEGVPHGKVIGPTALPSKVYPNTTRNYWVYVPAHYDASKPACLMIFFDGHAYVGQKGNYRIPYVFDNLIYHREMPVTIGVFINPGHTATQKEASDSDWGDGTTNRRVEYNALNDKYSKLIVDELLPVLKKDYKISDDPENRAVARKLLKVSVIYLPLLLLAMMLNAQGRFFF